MSKSKAAPAKRNTASSKAAGGAPAPLDLDAVFSPTGLAGQLATAAANLVEGLETGVLRPALEQNLELWVAIKMLLSRQNGQLDPSLSGSLGQTAETVTDTIFATGNGISPEALQWLISVNLELAKQLTNSVIHQMTADRAYFLWQEAGAVHGTDQQYWFTAEADIRNALANA